MKNHESSFWGLSGSYKLNLAYLYSLYRTDNSKMEQWRREAGASRSTCPGWKGLWTGCAQADEVDQNYFLSIITQNGRYPSKIALRLKKVCHQVFCVKTVGGKVWHSLA